VSNYVVSSYTPTLSALINARSQKNPATEFGKVLVLSQSNVQNLPPLPHARFEAAIIQSVIPSMYSAIAAGDEATVQSVVSNLPETTILHLACHGHQDPEDPLMSGFSLQDGRLTLAQLMEIHTPDAQLAYLSACETAGTDEIQPDEVLNLAATMLFVGFKSVIATLWYEVNNVASTVTDSKAHRSMNDLDGPFVAERVYKRLFVDGHLDLDAVPYALDAAVRDLRSTGVHPSRWATYVHIGA
jgi:CHAT domain-containing protein